jgi:hypothetical protein
VVPTTVVSLIPSPCRNLLLRGELPKCILPCSNFHGVDNEGHVSFSVIVGVYVFNAEIIALSSLNMNTE